MSNFVRFKSGGKKLSTPNAANQPIVGLSELLYYHILYVSDVDGSFDPISIVIQLNRLISSLFRCTSLTSIFWTTIRVMSMMIGWL